MGRFSMRLECGYIFLPFDSVQINLDHRVFINYFRDTRIYMKIWDLLRIPLSIHLLICFLTLISTLRAIFSTLLYPWLLLFLFVIHHLSIECLFFIRSLRLLFITTLHTPLIPPNLPLHPTFSLHNLHNKITPKLILNTFPNNQHLYFQFQNNKIVFDIYFLFPFLFTFLFICLQILF